MNSRIKRIWRYERCDMMSRSEESVNLPADTDNKYNNLVYRTSTQIQNQLLFILLAKYNNKCRYVLCKWEPNLWLLTFFQYIQSISNIFHNTKRGRCVWSIQYQVFMICRKVFVDFNLLKRKEKKKLFIRIATRNEMSEVKMCNSVKNIAIALHPMNF